MMKLELRRLYRHGKQLFTRAKQLGWVDDGIESPLEYLLRKSYEAGMDDAMQLIAKGDDDEPEHG